MIKYIAFDFVGVLVHEKDIEMDEIEEKLERKFGPNINDADYLNYGRTMVKKDSLLLAITQNLISKLYESIDYNFFNKLHDRYPDTKMLIATNHISFIREFVGDSFDVTFLNDLLISAEIHSIKPYPSFYQFILNKYHIKPDELLFIDDNLDNTDAAAKMGINTIYLKRGEDLNKAIDMFFKNN